MQSHRRMNAKSLWFAGLVALPMMARAAGPTPVTLEEATERALANAPQMAQARGAVKNASAAQRSAVGAWLPSLSLSAGSSLGGTGTFNPATSTGVAGDDLPLVSDSGSSPSLNAGVSASWELFSVSRFAQGRAAHAQSSAAEAGLLEQRASVVLLAVQAFSEEERAEALLGVAVSRLERAQQGLAAAEKRSAVGSATRSDVLRAQLEVNTAKAAVRSAEVAHASARDALGRLIGLDGPADARSKGPVQPTPLALADAQVVEAIVLASPQLRAAEADVQSADAAVGAATAQYFPTLRLGASYGASTRAVGASAAQNSWSVGLGLSLPIFDGFRREETVERARVGRGVATAVIDDLRRSLRASAERALRTVRLEEEQIDFAAQALEVAQEDLRVQQQRYGLGASTMLELLTSQSNLAQAEGALVTSRFDYQLARAELEALAGRSL